MRFSRDPTTEEDLLQQIDKIESSASALKRKDTVNRNAQPKLSEPSVEQFSAEKRLTVTAGDRQLGQKRPSTTKITVDDI